MMEAYCSYSPYASSTSSRMRSRAPVSAMGRGSANERRSPFTAYWRAGELFFERIPMARPSPSYGKYASAAVEGPTRPRPQTSAQVSGVRRTSRPIRERFGQQGVIIRSWLRHDHEGERRLASSASSTCALRCRRLSARPVRTRQRADGARPGGATPSSNFAPVVELRPAGRQCQSAVPRAPEPRPALRRRSRRRGPRRMSPEWP